MRQSTLPQWWLLLFVTTLVMTCVAAIRFAQGQGPLLAVTGFLASDCLLIANVFKNATVVLWIFAFLFLAVTLIMLFIR